jgi:hypothetical protein
MPISVFISHGHEDKALADALRKLMDKVFGAGPTRRVRVDYSSDNSPRRGIAPGAKWLDWILEVVRKADVCLVILTPDSVSKPWLTWEAGAVTGVALGTAPVSSGPIPEATVVPLLFGIGVDDIPEPLRQRQATNAQDTGGILGVVHMLDDRAGGEQPLADETLLPHASQFVREVQRVMQARLRAHPARLLLSEEAPFALVNSRWGLALEPFNGRFENGTLLYCERFTGDLLQFWQFYPVREGLYRIVPAGGPLTQCLSLQGDSKDSGAGILLWEYERDETQHWKLVPAAPSSALTTVRIVNNASGLCLMPTVGNKQLVQTNPALNYHDQDWWILASPTV